MSLISELRRRRVFRLAGLYLIGAWLVLQIADVTFAPLGVPDWSMTALIWVAAVGFLVAIALGWRYDIGDDGLIRVTPGADDTIEARQLSGSDYAILVAGVIAAGLFAWLVVGHLIDRTEVPESKTVAGNTIAVLPFRNGTDNASLTYFGDGVAEEITNHLSLIDELAVLAYSVSFGYRDPATDPRQIAADLGVDYVVTGSVRSDGDLLRVSAQLVEATTGQQFWSVDSGSVDPLDAILVQDAISTGVAGALVTELGLTQAELPQFAGSTPEAEAYDLYLKGRSIWFRRGTADIGEAVSHLAEAVRIDPSFARAWAALASAYLTWPAYSSAGYATWSEAGPAAEKALTIDPGLAEPHAVLASVAAAERRWFDAAEGFERALELDDQGTTTHYWYSELLSKTGRYAESVEHLARTLELDPLYVAPKIDAIFALLTYGETEFAVARFEAAWASGQRSPVVLQAGIIASVMARKFERARELIASSPLPEPHQKTLIQFLAVEAGELDRRTLIERLEDDPETRPDYRLLVWFAARVGALDFAMQTFNERVANHGSIETRMLWGPGHSLVEHADFVMALENVGIVDFWERTRIGDQCSLDGGALRCTAQPEGQRPVSFGVLLEQLGQ